MSDEEASPPRRREPQPNNNPVDDMEEEDGFRSLQAWRQNAQSDKSNVTVRRPWRRPAAAPAPPPAPEPAPVVTPPVDTDPIDSPTGRPEDDDFEEHMSSSDSEVEFDVPVNAEYKARMESQYSYRKKLHAAMTKDAKAHLMQKVGVHTRKRKGPPVTLTLGHPIKIRTSQEVFINSYYGSLQLCHTTVLMSGKVKEVEEDAEIKKAYKNGYIDLEHSVYRKGVEMFHMQAFVGEKVFVLRRISVIEKGAVRGVFAPSPTIQFRENLCDLIVIDEYKREKRHELSIFYTPSTQKNEHYFLKELSIFFVFSQPGFSSNRAPDASKNPTLNLKTGTKIPTPKWIIFQESALANLEYVHVVNNLVVPMRQEEKGFLIENELRSLSHTRTFQADRGDEDGFLYVNSTVSDVIASNGTVKKYKGKYFVDPLEPDALTTNIKKRAMTPNSNSTQSKRRR